jgi:hypothetical protein
MFETMPNKKRRIIERDLQTLFAPRAYITEPTIDDLKRLDLFHPSVQYENGVLYLSEQGVEALRRLVESLASLPVLTNNVSVGDINEQVLQCYSGWLNKGLQPTSQEFLEEVTDSLLSQVKCYEFLVKIEGIDLNGLNKLNLGSVRIQRSEPELLDSFEFDDGIDRESIYAQFKDSLWLIGSAKGSSNTAFERFGYRAVLTVGILGICGAVLYSGAIRRSRVRVELSPLENRKPVPTLAWEVGGKNPSMSLNFGPEQNLSINAKSVAYLSETCFLNQLSKLPDKENRSQLEDAILRAVYWFSEAYRDRHPTMQFIKLWSCAECFFSIDNELITEQNAQGIATILTFSGFGIVEVENYSKVKREVKRLYKLRSKAVHRAQFSHIDLKDLDALSRWVAWVVISMVALCEKGYTELRQIREQIQRFDLLNSGDGL